MLKRLIFLSLMTLPHHKTSPTNISLTFCKFKTNKRWDKQTNRQNNREREKYIENNENENQKFVLFNSCVLPTSSSFFYYFFFIVFHYIYLFAWLTCRTETNNNKKLLFYFISFRCIQMKCVCNRCLFGCSVCLSSYIFCCCCSIFFIIVFILTCLNENFVLNLYFREKITFSSCFISRHRRLYWKFVYT